MSLLDRAINFAKDTYNYVANVVTGGDNTKTDATKQSSKTNNNAQKRTQNTPTKPTHPNSTFEKKDPVTAQNFDAVETYNKDVFCCKKPDTKKNIVTHGDVIKKIKQINSKCKNFNVSYEEAKTNILANMNFSINEFNNLSNDEKLKKLNSIEAALDIYIVDKNKYNKDVDVTSLIGQSAKNIELATTEGGIKNAKEFKKYTKDVNKQILKRLSEAKTEEEKSSIIAEFRKEFKANIESERQNALKKCKNKEDIAKVNRRYDKRLEALEMQNAVDLTALSGPDNAYLSTYLVDGKKYGEVVKNSINVFKGDAKMSAANSHTMARRMQALKHHHEIGEDISADNYGEAIQYIAQNMSYDVLKQDEQEAYNFRLQHRDNLPEYLTEEHLTAQSVAYGMGATLNENLSTEQKAEFLKTWDDHAQQFSDYDEVRGKYYTELKQYLEKHPEAKQGIEDIKTKYHEKYGERLDVPKAAQKRYDARMKEQIKVDAKVSEVRVGTQFQKATSQQLEQALMTKPFDEVREAYTMNSDREFAEVVLHNPKLKNHKQHIVGFIKTLSAEDLSNITKGCNTEMFLFVLRNISPDKAGRLYDLSKSDKCYAARKLGEKIIEEGQENAAA